MADNPNVAKGGTTRSPGQALNPAHLSGAQGIKAKSLPVPQYSNPASGATYNTAGGPRPPYQMPIEKASAS